MALQAEFCTGYRIAVVETLEEDVPLDPAAPEDSPGGMALASLHRALTEIGHTLMVARCCMANPPAELWEQAHQMFQLAEAAGVLHADVRDPLHALRPVTSVQDAWERFVLLAGCDRQALRPATLARLHRQLEDWTRFVEVSITPPDVEAAIVVDLSGEESPQRVRGEELESWEDETVRFVDVSSLDEGLQAALAGRAQAEGPVLPEMHREEVARSALRAWGAQAMRRVERVAAGGFLNVVVGVSDIYRQLRHDEGGRSAAGEAPWYRYDLVDSSPRGFGAVSVEEDAPVLLPGDLLAVRRDGSGPWMIAVVRWVAGERNSRIGLEVISPSARTGAARTAEVTDETIKWQPVIVLPEHTIFRPAPTLVLACGAFDVGDEIELKDGRGSREVRLEALRSDSEAYREFRTS